MNGARKSLFEIFRIPLLVFAVSVAGLIVALLVEGAGDVIAVAAVAAPVIATLLFARQRR